MNLETNLGVRDLEDAPGPISPARPSRKRSRKDNRRECRCPYCRNCAYVRRFLDQQIGRPWMEVEAALTAFCLRLPLARWHRRWVLRLALECVTRGAHDWTRFVAGYYIDPHSGVLCYRRLVFSCKTVHILDVGITASAATPESPPSAAS